MTIKAVEIFPTKIWAEKDFLGTVHIKMQHEGQKEFDFIQIQYNWLYTSNSHQDELAQRIIKLLDGDNERTT
jgi:hypothetical protein